MTANRDSLLNNVIFFFFALFIFSSTFSIALSQISFGFSLLAFVILVILRRFNPFVGNLRNFYLAIGLYLLWMTLSLLVNDSIPKSLSALKEEWLFSVIPVGVYLFRQKHYRGALVIALAAGVIIVSIYGIIQHFTGVNWFKDYGLIEAANHTFYAIGGFRHNLTYGNYLAVAAMFLTSLAILRGKPLLSAPNLVILVAGMLGLVGTVMSYSRTAVAALPLGLIGLTWLKGKRWVLASTVVLVLTAGLTFLFVGTLAYKYKLAFERDLTGQQESSRLFIWKKSWAIIADHPVLGVGQGNFENAYAAKLDTTRHETRTRPHAHNDILNFAAIAGIPGATFFILIWVTLYYHLHQIWQRSDPRSDKRIFAGAATMAGAVFFLTSLTEATFADEEVRQLLMAIWAAGLWPMLSKKSEDEANEIKSP